MSDHTRQHDDTLLMRLLLGELLEADARHLQRRLADDAGLQERYERLGDAWNGLELPPVPPVPEGFRDSVVRSARRLAATEVSWSVAPAWARSGALVALVLGLVLGLGAGRLSHLPPADAAVVEDAELHAFLATELESGPLSLAEAYWLELEEDGASLLDGARGENPDGETL